VEIALQQTYAILAVLFITVFPFLWKKVIRPKISAYYDNLVLVEVFRRRNAFLNWLVYRHSVVTAILLGIGVMFTILLILQIF